MGDISVSMSFGVRMGDAIIAINKDAKFTIRGNKFPVEWMDGTTPIAEADITAKEIELQSDYDSKEYQRLREPEYPSIVECVHAILDGELDALQAKRKLVKDKYPKE